MKRQFYQRRMKLLTNCPYPFRTFIKCCKPNRWVYETLFNKI